MGYIIEKAEVYEGKTLSHFEDEHGNKLDDLYMVEGLVIVFTDGSRIALVSDHRGNSCYWSQFSQSKPALGWS